MKRNSKLLAFVIAIAMVMSVMTLPTMSVGAASENIIGQITSITLDGTAYKFEAGNSLTVGDYDAKWATQSTATLAYDNGVIKVSDRSDTNSGLKHEYAGVKANHTYYASAWIRQDEASTAAINAAFRFGAAQTSKNLATYKSDVLSTPLTNGAWVNVKGTFTVPQADDTTNKADHGLHMYFIVGTTANLVDYSIKDISVVDITDDPVVSGTEYITSNSKNGSFESDKEFAEFSGKVTSHDSVTEAAFAGSSSQKLVVSDKEASLSTYTARWLNILPDDTAGKKYAVSFYAKTAEGTNSISAYICETQLAKNTWHPEVRSYPSVEINADGWTKVTAYFEVERYTADHEDKVNNNATDSSAWGNKGFHAGVTVTGNAGTVYVDKFEVRELNALDLDSTCLAAFERFDNTVDAEIATTGTANTVYLIGVKYNGDSVADVKFAKTSVAPYTTASASCVGSLAISGIDDSYKLFVWDSNLKPLASVLSPFAF